MSSLPSADRPVLADYRQASLAALASAIGDSKNVALVDAPNQRNVGDALIWAGEIEYLKKLKVTLRYVSDLHSLSTSDLRRAMPEGVILIHGGGNFGDLWVGHQKAREKLVAEFPDYRVVQLPQTIYFQDPVAAEQADAVLGAHENFHVLVRDKPSLERAADQLPHVEVSYCYDMALGWEPPTRKAPEPEHDLIVIGRADKESSSGLSDLSPDWVDGLTYLRTDWHNAGLRWARWRAYRGASSRLQSLTLRAEPPKTPPTGTNWLLGHALTRINRLNIAGGVQLLRSGRVAVVDRLHAHVMAGLLGQPHVVLDNNYGKVSSIFHEYTGALSTAHYAANIDEAAELATMLVTHID